MSSLINNLDLITNIRVKECVLAPPKSVKIELNSTCNYSCSFCSVSSKNSRYGLQMDFNLFKALTKELKLLGVEEIGLFYMGEPFLYPKLVEAIEFVKKELKFSYVFLTTNGSLAKPNVVNQCMSAGLDSLKFSFNYFKAIDLAQNCKVSPKTLEIVMSNLRGALDLRDSKGYTCGVYASTIKSMYNNEDSMEDLPLYKEVNFLVDEHYFLPLFDQAGTVSEVQLGKKPIKGNQGRIGALRQPIPCWSLFNIAHITVEGDLNACCYDTTSRLNMGKLTGSNFMDIWNGETFKNLRTQHLENRIINPMCKSCLNL